MQLLVPCTYIKKPQKNSYPQIVSLIDKGNIFLWYLLLTNENEFIRKYSSSRKTQNVQ